ncbi:transient receptor potential cation channel subfamily M member-like 2 isoform X2 [Ostrea edulis]|uniref:transient receptor potential cation channel subfamily M member-like 2 isoform X2 n=1 Tax=Ostrea edulis TaxID=37623 RepID=UPI0024AFF8BB|nr:transient receptor potential cation channel subfamily M member-like 2 isoform X2 [Ostrea edulis]
MEDDILEYPEIEVDPVYVTVTSNASRISTDSADDLDWLQHSKLTGGIIKFLYDGSTEEKSHKGFYVCVAEDAAVEDVAKYISKVWRKRNPDIILSVISSLSHYKKWKNKGQVDDLQTGLIQAMNSTNMWVLTNGLDGGIAKIVGDAVRLERERRYILRSQAQDPYLKLTKKEELDELPKMTVIGVVPKLQLDCSASLEGIHDSIISLKKTGTKEAMELNGEHSHFIIMDQNTDMKELENFRLRVEERLLIPIGRGKKYRKIKMFDPTLNAGSSIPENLPVITSTCNPMVGLLIQGGPIDIDHVVDLLRRKVPVLVVQGTGLGADLISFVYFEKIHHEGDEYESFVKTELIKRMMNCYPKDFVDDELARNRCRDKILECVSLAHQENGRFLTVLDINADPEGLKNLDKYILLTLFESQGSKRGSQFQEQFQSDLKLTLDWNRPDLAESQIFEKYDWTTIKITPELFDKALLKRGREKFVEIFLNRESIVLHEYVNYKKLLDLFNNMDKPEFFCHLCLEGILAKSPGMSYPVGKDFIIGQSCELNYLLYKLTSLECLVSSYDLSMNSVGQYVCDKTTAERKALNALIYWSVLTYNPAVTKVLWKRSDQPLVMALMISMIWHNLAVRWCRDLDTKRQLKDSAIEFGKQAVKLLDLSYKDSCLTAIASLDEKLAEFNNKTTIKLAHIARNKFFIAHKSCQKWLIQRWHGNLLIREVDYGVFKLPNWLKIYLSVLFIFPMLFWITYEIKDGKEVKTTEEEEEFDLDQMDTPDMIPLKWKQKKSTRGKMKYQMREMFSYGRQNLKVPIYLQFYYLWSAPITKFYISQMFYIMYLAVFSYAVIIPSCGDFYIDLVVYFWTAMIWVEIIRKTIIKRKEYKEMKILWTVIEIGLIGAFLVVIGLVRIIPKFVPFIKYTTAKFVMSLGLLYFYYRSLSVFLPISPVLGPMMINFKAMMKKDFVTWLRMFLVFMIAGGITIQAVLYPNYPASEEGIVKAFSRAFFGMFLTKIDDLDSNPMCESFYANQTREVCFNAAASFWQRNTSQIRFRPEFAECPHRSFGGYAIVIQYLVITKLILLTLLYALFSVTNAKVQSESEEIWKYQVYSIIVDFETRLRLPAPFNFISYIIMLIEFIFKKLKLCMKKCCKSSCCMKDKVDSNNKVSVVKVHGSVDYSYWKNCMKKLNEEAEKEEREAARPKEQSQRIQQLVTQSKLQKEFNDKMTEQMSNLERQLITCSIALEQIAHKIDTIDPKARPELVTSVSLHMASRESPYPNTKFQRFPVFDKYVSWEEAYSTYDPVLYTKPIDEYRESVQSLVDADFIELAQHLEMSSQSQDERASVLSASGYQKPLWNLSATFIINDASVEVNRLSWITRDGLPVRYELDSSDIPINPMGRTGMRGRGKLRRWGPNHCVMVVVSRWKRYLSTSQNQQNFMKVDGKKVLEVVVLQKKESGEFTLPSGKEYGNMSVYSAMCRKFLDNVFQEKTALIDPDMTAQQMVQFFEQFVEPHPGPFTGFTTEQIYKGYMDDPCNTDNAWREAEVWNIHYHVPDNLDLKIKDKEKKWKEVSSYLRLPGNQNLIVHEAARNQGAYY